MNGISLRVRCAAATLLFMVVTPGVTLGATSLSVGYESLKFKERWVNRTERYDGTGTFSSSVGTATFSRQQEKDTTLNGIGIRGRVSGEFLLKHLSVGLEGGVILPLDFVSRDWSVPSVSTAANSTTTGTWQDSGIQSFYLIESYSQTGKEEIRAVALPALVRAGYEIGMQNVRLTLGAQAGGYLVHVRRAITKTKTYVMDSGGWKVGQTDTNTLTYSSVVGVPAYGGSMALGIRAFGAVIGLESDITMLGTEKALFANDTTGVVRTSDGQKDAAPTPLAYGPEVGGLSISGRLFVKY